MPTKTKKPAEPKVKANGKARGKVKKQSEATPEIPVVWDRLEAHWHVADPKLVAKGTSDEFIHPPLTAENAKAMLGWEQEPAHLKWREDEYLFRDAYGNKIKCVLNSKNRPFNDGWSKALSFDILNRHWADSRNGEGRTINGETVIIGRHGTVMSAQHRLIGLVLAHQAWELQPHWKDLWAGEPPTIECIVVYGVDEGHDTVRTLDNTRPRTTEDVFITEASVFGRQRAGERREMCRLLSSGIKFLWDRTGAKEDAWHPYRTHSETVIFEGKHPRIARCVKHIWELNRPPKKTDDEGAAAPRPIKRFIDPGIASGLMYLMASSGTEGDSYWGVELAQRGDNVLDWSYWDAAVQFWADLAGNRLLQVNHAIAALVGPEGTGDVDAMFKQCIICKAWKRYRENEDFGAEDIMPALTEPNELGKRFLDEAFDVGGIDQGRARPGARGRDDDEEGDEEGGEGEPASREDLSPGAGLEEKGREPGDPTPEEIEAAAEEARQRRDAEKEAEKERRKEARKQALKDRHARVKAGKEKGGVSGSGPSEGCGL
jgi:hypothetical protein